MGPDGQKQNLLSGSQATIERRLFGGSEAVHIERKDSTENLPYQNPTLYVQYQLEKTNMEKQYAGKWRFKIGIERHL